MGLEGRSRRFQTIQIALMLASMLGACRTEQNVLIRNSPSDAAPNDASLVATTGQLRLDPAEVTVLVDPAGVRPSTQRFRAYRIDAEGASRDEGPPLRWTSDKPEKLSFDAQGVATVAALFQGDAIITATDGQTSATARLRVRLGTVFFASGVSSDAPTFFSGPSDPDWAPEILYPLAQTLLPTNLPSLPVRFRRHLGSSLFEITLTNDLTNVRLYIFCKPEADGCTHDVDESVWRAVVDVNRGRRLSFSVRSAGLGSTGTSPARDIFLAEDDIKGTLHYWTTSASTAVMRWNTSQTGRKGPERMFGNEVTKECVGCHATSPDGTRTVVTTGPAGELGRSFLYDFAKAETHFLNRAVQAATFAPDGLLFAAVTSESPSAGPKNLVLFSGKDGKENGTISLRGMRPAHPDWSPDGTRIVFSAVDTKNVYPQHRPGQGGVAFVERDGMDWRSPRTVMGALPGSNFHSPAFAPDSARVAVVESICDTGSYGPSCDTDNDPITRLWLAPVPMLTEGVQARPLDIVNRGGLDDRGTGLGLSSPHFHPQAARGPDGRRIFWLTFSSIRRFGLRAPPLSARQGAAGAWLWTVAVDAEAPGGKPEAAFAPFILPWQDLATSNHAGQWTAAPE